MCLFFPSFCAFHSAQQNDKTIKLTSEKGEELAAPCNFWNRASSASPRPRAAGSRQRGAEGHHGAERWAGGVMFAPDAGRTFNLLICFLIVTFSMATTELQRQETDGEIKYIHGMHTPNCKTAEFSNGFKGKNSHSPEISHYGGRVATKNQNEASIGQLFFLYSTYLQHIYSTLWHIPSLKWAYFTKKKNSSEAYQVSQCLVKKNRLLPHPLFLNS